MNKSKHVSLKFCPKITVISSIVSMLTFVNTDLKLGDRCNKWWEKLGFVHSNVVWVYWSEIIKLMVIQTSRTTNGGKTNSQPQQAAFYFSRLFFSSVSLFSLAVYNKAQCQDVWGFNGDKKKIVETVVSVFFFLQVHIQPKKKGWKNEVYLV